MSSETRTSPAPPGLRITPHEPVRTLGDRTPRYWFDGRPFETHHFNALSSTFPLGEEYFIKSVLGLFDRIESASLREDVRRFVRQEGRHRIEHAHHVDVLTRQGYPAFRRIERIQRRLVHPLIDRFPRLTLATTAGVEHLTAILSHEMLGHPERWIDRMHEDMRSLWRWHAAEEIEHKAVAFDVYQEVCGSHALRVAAMLLATAYVYLLVTGRRTYLLWRDGLLWRPRLWRDGLAFLWGRRGAYRSVWRQYARFYRRDFHPWRTDDLHLAEEVLGGSRGGARSRPGR